MEPAGRKRAEPGVGAGESRIEERAELEVGAGGLRRRSGRSYRTAGGGGGGGGGVRGSHG